MNRGLQPPQVLCLDLGHPVWLQGSPNEEGIATAVETVQL